MADPVSIVVTPIVTKLIEIAAELVKEEIILRIGVSGEIKKLQEVLQKINCILLDAEEQQISSNCSRELKLWLYKLREVALDAEDTLDLFASKALKWKHEGSKKINKVRKFFQHSSTSAREVRDMLERFESLNRDKDIYNLRANARSYMVAEVMPETGHSLISDVVGIRENCKEEIIKALLTEPANSSNDLDVISIVGIGGSGKTTLAQLVFNDKRIRDCFDKHRMWVCVNVNFDLKRIMREMITHHSYHDLTRLSKSQLESRLKECLSQRRFLLVLDNVWTENVNECESLKGLLNLGAKGSRVLVTTRDTKVADMMSTGPVHHPLDNLNEDESWELFSKCAFINGHIPDQDLEEIGRGIVGKCSGLPLAIKAMAGLLRGSLDVKKWDRILMSEIWKLEEQNNLKVMPALMVSYTYLPSELKQCFLLCSIFPKGHSFVKDELVKIWIAEVFINSETPEDTGNSYFDQLLCRSLFLFSDVGRSERYRMHDLIHDLALSLSKPLIKEGSRETNYNSRHVPLQCENIATAMSYLIDKGKKVRTILFRGGNFESSKMVLRKLFSSLKYIRVLDLSSSPIVVLPDSIKELKLLRYLDLSFTEIKMLPNSICNLSNLQTLRLLCCFSLCELPNGLVKLRLLRHLELDKWLWQNLSRFLVGVGSLRNLHNLHKFCVAPKKGYGVKELQDLNSLTGTLHLLRLENAVNAWDAKLKEKSNLLKVVFEWSKEEDGAPVNKESQESTLHNLHPPSKLEELKIINFSGSKFSSWMTDGSLKKLTKISLNHCINCKTLLLGQLPKLIRLSLVGMHNLEELGPEAHWPLLWRLKISGCPKLRVLPWLLNIPLLEIKGCELLKALPVTPLLSFLTPANNAHLEEWNEVECIFLDSSQEEYVRYSLKIDGVEIIRKPMMVLPQHFSQTNLIGCHNLTRLSLDTSDDGTLLTRIPDCGFLHELAISNVSTLSNFPQLRFLPGLKSLYIRGWVNLEHISENLHNLTSLKLLSIENCPKLRGLDISVFPPTLKSLRICLCPSLTKLEMLKASMTRLKYISIENCEALASVPEDGFPDSFLRMWIHGCPLLAERFRKGDYSKIPYLEFSTVLHSSKDNK